MTTSEAIQVLLVEDHPAVREGLRGILKQQKMQVVAEASNGQEALDLYRQHQPEITLMDLRMPVMDGLTATRAILAAFPDAQIIILTNAEGEEENSQKAGAKALVQKDAPSEQLIQVIHAVHNAAS